MASTLDAHSRIGAGAPRRTSADLESHRAAPHDRVHDQGNWAPGPGSRQHGRYGRAVPSAPEPYRITITVRGYHVDVYGHVNNARYLEFLEEARWGLFEDRTDLASILREGPALVVVSITVNYRSQATVGDRLVVSAAVSRIGDRSAVIHQDVHIAGSDRLVADADVTFVMVDRQTGRPIAIGGDVREVLERLL